MEPGEYQFLVRANYNGECLSEISNVTRPTIYPCAENYKCELTISAIDLENDGWDFGYISIKGSLSDMEYKAELSDLGSTNNPVTIPFELCPDTYQFTWFPGNWDEEVGFAINFQGEELYRANFGDIDTTFKKKPMFFEYEIACEPSEDEEEPGEDEPTEGVEESTSSLNIHPNPVKDRLYIETQTLTLTIEIYDVFGRRQQLSAVSHQPTVINVEDLKSGIYFVKIVTENGEIVQRFVKK